MYKYVCLLILASCAFKQTLGQDLKSTLLPISLADCCPDWQTLASNGLFKKSDVMSELKQAAYNVTDKFIDGQPGESERVRYYHFYDEMQYLIRLIRVARANSSRNARKMSGVIFDLQRDALLSSFVKELCNTTVDAMFNINQTNSDFDLYEDFILRTQFGRQYAANLSLIQESVLVFNQIYDHLAHFDYPNNLTRPSKQYQIIRRLATELYFIKDHITRNISPKTIQNRQDVQQVFGKLEELVAMRPYIRMLGDDFNVETKFLNNILEAYLTNNLTQYSFYTKLSELPQDYITLGASIAHHYEDHEVPNYNNFRSQAQLFNPNSTSINQTNQLQLIAKTKQAPRGNLSILSRFF